MNPRTIVGIATLMFQVLGTSASQVIPDLRRCDFFGQAMSEFLVWVIVLLFVFTAMINAMFYWLTRTREDAKKDINTASAEEL